MKKFLYLLLAMASVLSASAADIFLAGDSTMADYARTQAPQTGWGQALKAYAKAGVNVYNFARGGRSSKSFRDEGSWLLLLNQVLPGDFVFIQFGHNDAHQGENNQYRHTEADTDYYENIRQYIRDVRAKNATPIICTPIVFMSYRDGKINQSEYFAKYSAAARRAAAAEQADLIDLNAWSQEELTRLGVEKAKEIYMFVAPGKYEGFPKGREDTCHLQENGAHFYVQGMLKLAREQKLAVADCFNDTPSAKAAVAVSAKQNDAGSQVSIKDDFRRFVIGGIGVMEESERPWDYFCMNGGQLPVCKDGVLSIDHKNGEVRVFSKAKVTVGRFKARIRFNDANGSFNAFIGLASVDPWMKYGACFHFDKLDFSANVSVNGQSQKTPPLPKGEWHDLEVRFASESITYLLDGQELYSGDAPQEKGALSALFVVNSRNGGTLNLDIDSVEFEGERALPPPNAAVPASVAPAPAAEPEEKPADVKYPYGMKEIFNKFSYGEASVAIEDESENPWQLQCVDGAEAPVCQDGMLKIDHKNGEVRIISKAKVTVGRFKARCRFNDAQGLFNVFLGMVSPSPWMKYGASFHFDKHDLSADMSINGKTQSTPSLQKGQWHDLEIHFTQDKIFYLLDGKVLCSGPAPKERGAMSALFVINSRKGGAINLDLDSVEFDGVRATPPAPVKYTVPVPVALAPRPEPAPAPLQIARSQKIVTVSNRYLAMTFDVSQDIVLTSLVNKYSGRELLAQPSAFYSVFLKRSRTKVADYQVKEVVTKNEQLVFKLESASTKTALTITLGFAADSPEYTAEMSLDNLSSEDLEAAGQWVFQGLQFGEDISKDGIFFPFESGMAGILDVELNHPYGLTATIQMLTGFDTAEGGSFYGFTTDTTGYSKLLSLIKTSNGKRPPVVYTPLPDDIHFWPRGIFDYRLGTSLGWRNFEIPAKAGESAVLVTGKFGVGPSDWRDGIASYRKFSKTFLKKRHIPPQWYQDCYIHLSSHPNGNHHQMTPYTHKGGYFDVVNKRFAYAKAMGHAEKRSLQEIAFWWDYGPERAFMTTNEMFRAGGAPCDFQYNIWRGGLPALRQEIKDIHAKEGRLVFYTFPELTAKGSELNRLFGKQCSKMGESGEYSTSYCSPGDFYLCPLEHSWVEHLARRFGKILKETGADGVRLDVLARNNSCFNPNHKHYDGTFRSSMAIDKLAEALSIFQDRIHEASPNAAVTVEHAGTDFLMQYVDGWFSENIIAFADSGRWGPYRHLNAYQMVFSRFTFPESKVWMHSVGFPRESAMMSLFNAVGFCVTRAEGQYTSRTLEENADLINACVDPVPYIPTLHPDIFANYFPAPGQEKVLYGVYNRSDKTVKAEVLEVEDAPGYHYMELWADKDVPMRKVDGKVRLTAEIEGDTAGNIVRLPELLKAEIQPDGMLHVTVGDKEPKYDALELKIAYDEDKFDEEVIVCQPYNGEVLLPLRNDYHKLIIKLVDGIYLRDQVVINKANAGEG